MGVEVMWDNTDKTVIQMVYEGRWQWDDVRSAVDELNEMIESVNHKAVHIISNRGNANWTPGHYASNLRDIIGNMHPRAGHRVFVVKNMIAREMFFIFSAGEGGMPFPYHFVSTLEEARDFLIRCVMGKAL